MSSKRENYISWDEYFMGVCKLASMRSKDPNTQVGATIVDSSNHIISIGYNGFPVGCSDDEFPWDREGDSDYDTKYAYVCHAELNAILNAKSADLKGDKVFVTLFPCENCTKALIQKGISEIIYDDDKYHDTAGAMASRKMFDAAGIIYRKYNRSGKTLSIEV